VDKGKKTGGGKLENSAKQWGGVTTDELFWQRDGGCREGPTGKGHRKKKKR